MQGQLEEGENDFIDFLCIDLHGPNVILHLQDRSLNA